MKKIFLFSSLLSLIGLIYSFLFVDKKDLEDGGNKKQIQKNNRTDLKIKQQKKKKPLEKKYIGKNTVKKINNEMGGKVMWEEIERPESYSYYDKDLHVDYIRIDPKIIKTLKKGMALYFPVEKSKGPLKGTITEMEKGYGETMVYKGALSTGLEYASFIITRGVKTTIIMIATGKKIYQIEVINESGIGSVLNEDELDKYKGKGY